MYTHYDAVSITCNVYDVVDVFGIVLGNDITTGNHNSNAKQQYKHQRQQY